ncbi:hypothetical protein Btru_056312 [Bulinus truncatus]|nr:hypothetical protein Btru_056312 [Bulinus truncatus]
MSIVNLPNIPYQYRVSFSHGGTEEDFRDLIPQKGYFFRLIRFSARNICKVFVNIKVKVIVTSDRHISQGYLGDSKIFINPGLCLIVYSNYATMVFLLSLEPLSTLGRPERNDLWPLPAIASDRYRMVRTKCLHELFNYVPFKFRNALSNCFFSYSASSFVGHRKSEQNVSMFTSVPTLDIEKSEQNVTMVTSVPTLDIEKSEQNVTMVTSVPTLDIEKSEQNVSLVTSVPTLDIEKSEQNVSLVTSVPTLDIEKSEQNVSLVTSVPTLDIEKSEQNVSMVTSVPTLDIEKSEHWERQINSNTGSGI